ncbi:MAG: hypothetical protein ABIS86_12270 [Streptosporangiaceae bacterium]
MVEELQHDVDDRQHHAVRPPPGPAVVMTLSKYLEDYLREEIEPMMKIIATSVDRASSDRRPGTGRHGGGGDGQLWGRR